MIMAKCIVRMPALDEDMTHGKLLCYLVGVGETVQAGDPIAEVEADKANVEIDAPVGGRILSLAFKASSSVAVGAELAVIEQYV